MTAQLTRRRFTGALAAGAAAPLVLRAGGARAATTLTVASLLGALAVLCIYAVIFAGPTRL